MRTAQEQFAHDYLMVVMNDQDAYDEITQLQELSSGRSVLADRLKWDFEEFVQTLSEEVEEEGNNVGAMLLRELLLGFGDDAWLSIAQHIQTSVVETDEVAPLSSH